MTLVGYFAVKVGSQSHLRPGIYLRSGRHVLPMFLFVKSAGYNQRFDLQKLGQRIVSGQFGNQFSAAYQQAIGTAR